MKLNEIVVKSVRVAIATAIAGGVLWAPTAFAQSADRLILVPPTSLPAVAREGGDGMFLHVRNDGRMFLYIQRKQGLALAVLDVTDPAHIIGAAAVPFATPGPSDLVSSPPGVQDMLVRDVRARLTNAQTGSTFLLTDNGLYVVRRPDDEWIKRFRDQAYEN
jgi:hypothetical protein